MKKHTHLLLLTALCGVSAMALPTTAFAYVYRYHPGSTSVMTDPTLLNDSMDAPPSPSANAQSRPVTLTPPSGTAPVAMDMAPTDISPAATTPAVPVVPVESAAPPAARKKLARPFFSTVDVPPAVMQAPAVIPAYPSAAPVAPERKRPAAAPAAMPAPITTPVYIAPVAPPVAPHTVPSGTQAGPAHGGDSFVIGADDLEAAPIAPPVAQKPVPVAPAPEKPIIEKMVVKDRLFTDLPNMPTIEKMPAAEKKAEEKPAPAPAPVEAKKAEAKPAEPHGGDITTAEKEIKPVPAPHVAPPPVEKPIPSPAPSATATATPPTPAPVVLAPTKEAAAPVKKAEAPKAPEAPKPAVAAEKAAPAPQEPAKAAPAVENKTPAATAKPAETASVEKKPAEKKPVETKTAETKPAEEKPAEVKPAPVTAAPAAAKKPEQNAKAMPVEPVTAEKEDVPAAEHDKNARSAADIKWDEAKPSSEPDTTDEVERPAVMAAAKPVESKPVETKAPEAKAAETKSDDVKPAAEPAAAPSLSDLTISFDANSSTLSGEATHKLDGVAAQMEETLTLRLQIRAYAKGDDSGESTARRMSLSRALIVRSYLMDKGIKPTRLDVRALGTGTDQASADRADLVFVR